MKPVSAASERVAGVKKTKKLVSPKMDSLKQSEKNSKPSLWSQNGHPPVQLDQLVEAGAGS